MEFEHREDRPPESAPEDPERTSEVPPDTSDHPSHEEEVGGKGAEDADELAEEERYRKGPGW